VRREQYARHRIDLGARAFGVSFHERELAAKVIGTPGGADISFVRYNPVHRGAEKDLFPHIRDHAPQLVFNFKSTYGHLVEADYVALGVSPEHWRPPLTEYYRYALARPELDGLLCSFGTLEHVEAMAKAIASGPLTEEETSYLSDLADLATGEARLA
jgi:hypothetical protein